MAGVFEGLLNIIAPTKTARAGGVAATGTYDPNSTTGVVTMPLYRDHLIDIFTTRQADDSRDLIKKLMIQDPDMSAAASAFLTLANTKPIFIARALDGSIDRENTKQIYNVLRLLTTQLDYTQGFQMKPSLAQLCENMRYMILLRGMITAEIVYDKNLAPSELRMIDPASIQWIEKNPGLYKPEQIVKGQSKNTSLDIPTFFASYYRRDPTQIYAYSPFVSAINTIAARQQIINDLYRIMRITGFPRIDVKVVEEVIMKSAPPLVKNDEVKMKEYLKDRIGEVAQVFNNLRPDQAAIHLDSVEISILNEKNPGLGIDITSVIETLNAQNQAALKTMATIIGRGTSGVNTASVEARIAAMNADELNEPLADILQDMLSFILQTAGQQVFVEVYFRKCELRPEMELEPQLLIKAGRLQTELSLGLISDDEYHLEMRGVVKPDDAEELSGTGFMQPVEVGVDAEKTSPNGGPIGRGMTSKGSKAAKSKTVKKPA